MINYDFPLNPADYIHRVGRAGRVGSVGQTSLFSIGSVCMYVKQSVMLIKVPLLALLPADLLDIAVLF